MVCKTPQFWYQPPGIISALLTPAAWLYQIGHGLNQSLKPAPYHTKTPVICIGNAVAGGSGKTPAVISLVNLIKKNSIAQNPFILTRGYGSTIKTPTLVDTTKHTAIDVGDESLLLARHTPTIISANRAEGAKLAERNSADLIIMDDGLFNNTLHKDINFLVVDRQMDFGNNKTIPAGPLREPLKKVLPKIQGIICIGRPFHSDLDVFESQISVTTTPDTHKNYIAFAGLGHPKKFKNTLENLNINLVGWYPFPDHHVYTDKEIESLKKETADKNATLITTEKDLVRLLTNLSKDIETLPIELTFKEPNKLVTFLQNKTKKAS